MKEITYKNDFTEEYYNGKSPVLEIHSIKDRVDDYIFEDIKGNYFRVFTFISRYDWNKYTYADVRFNHNISQITYDEYQKKREDSTKNNNVIYVNETYSRNIDFQFIAEKPTYEYDIYGYKYNNLIEFWKKDKSYSLLDRVKHSKWTIIEYLETQSEYKGINCNLTVNYKYKELRFHIVLEDGRLDKYKKLLLSKDLKGNCSCDNLMDYLISTFRETFEKYGFLENVKIKVPNKPYKESETITNKYFINIMIYLDSSYAPKHVRKIILGTPIEKVCKEDSDGIKLYKLENVYKHSTDNRYMTNYYRGGIDTDDNWYWTIKDRLTQREFYVYKNANYVSYRNKYNIDKILKGETEKDPELTRREKIFDNVMDIIFIIMVLLIFIGMFNLV